MFRRALYDLIAVSGSIQAAQREFGKKIGVSASQFVIIRVVAEGGRLGGTTVTEITRTLRLHSSFVVLQTGLLVKKGILKRIRNPTDNRSALLLLTKKGEALVVGVGPMTQLANNSFFGWMTRKDFERFAATLAKLVQLGPASLSALRAAPPISSKPHRRGQAHQATSRRAV